MRDSRMRINVTFINGNRKHSSDLEHIHHTVKVDEWYLSWGLELFASNWDQLDFPNSILDIKKKISTATFGAIRQSQDNINSVAELLKWRLSFCLLNPDIVKYLIQANLLSCRRSKCWENFIAKSTNSEDMSARCSWRGLSRKVASSRLSSSTSKRSCLFSLNF